MSSILDVSVLFEDLQVFPGVSYPQTFRVQVEARSISNWTIETVELPSDSGPEWVALRPAHPLFHHLLGSARLARTTVEDAIRTAMAEARERAAWDRADVVLEDA